MTKFAHALRLASIALALAVVAGCNQPLDPESLIAKAQRYREQGNHQAAIIELKNAVQKNPDHAEARYLLGAGYLDVGDPKSAEAELRRALTLGADPAKAQPALARSLLAQGRFFEVLDATDPARIPEAKDPVDMLNVRGFAQLYLRRPAEAKQLFDQALVLRPDNVESLLGHARLAALQKKWDEAGQFIDRAIAGMPKNIEAWVMKGDLAQATGDEAAAVAAYQKVLEIKPDYLPARLSIASLQIAAGNLDEARKQIDQVRKIAPTSVPANFMQARIDFRQHNYAAAREAVQKVLKVSPDYMPAVLMAGALEYRQGSQGQAQLHLSRVIDRAPDNLYARKLLASSLAKSSQVPRALEVIQPALKQAPGDGELLSLAGDLYMHNNEFIKAAEFFDKATKVSPQSAEARTRLGQSRLAMGETERALADLESAVQLDAQKYQADVVLVMSLMRREKYDEALKALASLEKKQPTNPLTFNLKAGIYIGKKDPATARKHLEHALVLQPTYVAAAANLARLDLEAKKPQDARRRFEAILEKDKDNLDALLALANLALSINATLKEQIDWLERARKVSAGSVQPHLMLARLYAKTGETKKALEIARQVEATSPDNPEVLDTLGTLQILAGDKNVALTTYRRLATLQPNSPAALYGLAGAQAINADPAAVGTLKKVLALKPDHTDAQMSLVDIQTRGGNFAEALKIAQQVQKQAPKSSLGFVLEGDVLMVQKKFAQAARAYETAYGIAKSSQLVMKLHSAYAGAGKPQEAEARLAQWLKASPEDAVIRLYTAETKLRSGEFKGAIEQFEWLLQKQPDNVSTLNNLAWAYQQAKDPRALETIERAYKLKPGNPAVADTLGWILVEQGNTRRGIEILQRAVVAAPDSLDFRFHLAQALAKSGDKARAIDHLERLLDAGTKFPQESEAIALLRQLKK